MRGHMIRALEYILFLGHMLGHVIE